MRKRIVGHIASTGNIRNSLLNLTDLESASRISSTDRTNDAASDKGTRR